MGVEYTKAHGPDSKKSFCFAPGVPVFLQKKKSCVLQVQLKTRWIATPAGAGSQ
jgi:hypothetical protein